MKNSQLVLLLVFLILLSPVASKSLSVPGQIHKDNTSTQNESLLTNNLHLQIFSNKRFINEGESINITFTVYYSNFTIQSNLPVNFNIGNNQFTKYSSIHISSFILQVNKTFTTITLQASIPSDNKSIVFYNTNQEPSCQSSCLQGLLSATQLQVFNNFNSSFKLSLQSNVQWILPTDIISVTIKELQIISYFSVTNTSFYGTNPSYLWNYSLLLSVPIVQPGTYTFIFTYYSTYYGLLQTTKQVTIASSAITYSLTNYSVDRLNIGESAKDFITYTFGFSIANLQYNYFISNNESIVYSSVGSLDNIVLQLPIEVKFYYNVGIYFLNLELTSNNKILYTKLVQITVYDNIITNLQFNNSITDNQLTIPFQLTTYIEDTLVTIPTTVTIVNGDTNKTLIQVTGGLTQYFSLSFTNTSAIPKDFIVYTLSNNSFYKGSMKSYPIYVREQTTIVSNYKQTIQAERLQNIQLSVQVSTTKTNESITSGKVDLVIDGSIATEISLNTTNTINYVIPVNLTVGKHALTLNFLGTNSLEPSSINYDLYIFSNVHFTDVSVNNTFTNPTTPILVTGYVQDENNTGIITKVALINNNNTIIDQTVTSSDGEFSFILLNTNILGYYNYKLQAMAVNYYKSAEYQFNLLQNNVFSITIKANETMKLASITVKGDIYGVYQLSYYTQNSKQFNITQLDLDSTGSLQANFLTPNVLGPVFFNVTNIKNPSQTCVQKEILYKDPNVVIQQLNDAYVGENVNISITSAVVYNLFFNDKLVTNQNYFINKTMISLPVQTKGLNQLKLVFQSEYVTTPQVLYDLFVYEQVKLIQNLPAKINENTNITTYLQVVNSQNVPLGNVHIAFMYKGHILFNVTTDNKGNVKTFISINDALSNYKFRVSADKEAYINQEDFSINTILIRTLTVTSNINTLQFNDLTGTAVTFTVTYKNTGQPAPLVNMTIEIIDQNQAKTDYNLETSNAGTITIQISKPVGKYILTVITNNPDYIMSKAVYNFQVKAFNVVNNPFLLPSLLLGGFGTIFILRKKALK